MRSDQVCECRANVAIEEGEEITDFYVSPLHGTQYRRKCLRDGWYFQCRCKRCQGLTENEYFICVNKILRITKQIQPNLAPTWMRSFATSALAHRL